MNRLDVLTLAVPDVDVARRFYLDGLGLEPLLDLPGEIVFLQLNHGLTVALWSADRLAQDVGVDPASVVPGQGFTLARNTASEGEVDALTARAEAAGAQVLRPPRRAAFGGYHSYVQDPSGVRWEIAHNPGLVVGADGTVHLQEIA
ncbi:VOC family protein [Kineococcus sp. SYSU DK001]|uniref:VOC family protein n=1 Tax=Kineococcus sp. SYSU DK001 TaxID=3383122 RepID=UPI003D7EAE46